MTKRRGATSDNVFIFQKINENENKKRKKRSCGRFWTQSFSLCSSLTFRFLFSRAVSLEKMTKFGPLLLKLVQPSLNTIAGCLASIYTLLISIGKLKPTVGMIIYRNTCVLDSKDKIVYKLI